MYKVIGVDQRVYGPVSAEYIRQWLAEGRLNAASLAQVEGAADWRPLSTFPEFIPPPIMTPPPASAPVSGDSASGFATAALVLGIAANVCCGLRFVCGILGIVFAIIALQRMEGHPNHSGRALAWAGLGLSLFGMFSGFLLVLTALGEGDVVPPALALAMKFNLTLKERRTLSRSEAWGCFSANLAMPGAGSLAAGRKVGYAQMVLALGGMGISVGTGIGMVRWGLANWTRLYSLSDADYFGALLEMWQHMKWPLLGLLIFGISISWAALTGWRLVNAAPKEGVPPKIS